MRPIFGAEICLVLRVLLVALAGTAPGMLFADLYEKLYGGFSGLYLLGAAFGALFGAGVQWFSEREAA